MSAKSELVEITALIASLGGVVIDKRQNKHICLRVRFGCVDRTIAVATTNSDKRGHKNKLAEIRRVAREASAHP